MALMADELTRLERLVEEAVRRLTNLATERDELKARVMALEGDLGRLAGASHDAERWEVRRGAALQAVAEALAELRRDEQAPTDDARGFAS